MDERLVIIRDVYPESFQEKVNSVLNEGGWRVTETDMSPSDNFYYAMLVREAPEKKG